MAEAQNFTLGADNFTDHEFTLKVDLQKFGKVTDNNPIRPNAVTVEAFRTSGDDSAAAGTEGVGTYVSKDGKASFNIAWDIPWGLGDDYLRIYNVKGCNIVPLEFMGKSILRRAVQIVINNERSRR